MRPIEEINEVLALVENGFNDCEIARQTGVPRGTVRDWRQGKLPRRYSNARRRENGSSCPTCGHPAHLFDQLPKEPYAYLLGLYLGDGCISSAAEKPVFKLRIVLDRRYTGIIAGCAQAMRAVMPGSKVNTLARIGCVEVYSYSRAWPCLLPQHGAGPKHHRTIELVDWQDVITYSAPEQLLRGLIQSDGCRVTNRVTVRGRHYRYPRYFFSNRSPDIRAIFCRHCDLIGVDWRQDGPWNISVARRKSVQLLDSFIGPKG